MAFHIRPARKEDFWEIHSLATSLWAHGFLTLPSDEKELKELMGPSEAEAGKEKYLFVMTDQNHVIGTSLVVARHGTPQSPHYYFEVDSEREVLRLGVETTGRTELGGLILDPAFRSHPLKLGKAISYVRFLLIRQSPEKFCREILAELLPCFTPEGRSPLWEVLGKKLTGLEYPEADLRSRKDPDFIRRVFPSDEISIKNFPADVKVQIGKPGLVTEPVAKILTELGFRYLNQVDPFDGGPHYGASITEVCFDKIDAFFASHPEIEVTL